MEVVPLLFWEPPKLVAYCALDIGGTKGRLVCGHHEVEDVVESPKRQPWYGFTFRFFF